MEYVATDAERLLRQIGAWEEYGASGWGVNNTEAIFSSQSNVKHATNATDKLRMVLSPTLEKELDIFYADDYTNPYLNLTKITVYDSNLRY